MTSAELTMMEATPTEWRMIFDRARTAGVDTPQWRRLYAVYLKSPAWTAKREAAIQSAGGECSRCHTTHTLEAHHKNYARVGDEAPNDLEVRCRVCHWLGHSKIPVNIKPPYRRRYPLLHPDDVAQVARRQLARPSRVWRRHMSKRYFIVLDGEVLGTVSGSDSIGVALEYPTNARVVPEKMAAAAPDYFDAAEAIRLCVENAEPGEGCPFVIPAELIEGLLEAHRKAQPPEGRKV